MAFMAHWLCQCFAPSVRALLAGILAQQHAGRVRIENLKTRETVEDLPEELVRFLETTKTRVCSVGKMPKAKPHKWRTYNGNVALPGYGTEHVSAFNGDLLQQDISVANNL